MARAREIGGRFGTIRMAACLAPSSDAGAGLRARQGVGSRRGVGRRRGLPAGAEQRVRDGERRPPPAAQRSTAETSQGPSFRGIHSLSGPGCLPVKILARRGQKASVKMQGASCLSQVSVGRLF